jgi:hypothetical protein
MKLTNESCILIAGNQSFQRILGDSRLLPFKVTYWLKRFKDRIYAINKVTDDERIKIARELADKDEAGKPVITNDMYIFSSENQVKFNEELRVLSDKENDMVFNKIKLHIADVPVGLISEWDITVLEEIIEFEGVEST